MPPAARINDRHTCSQSDGAIIPSGCKSVLIGGRPAARRGDVIQCGGKRVEIQEGEASVLIGDEEAARVGDPVTDGGMIVQGDLTVCIGSNTPCDCMRKKRSARSAFVRSPSLGAVARQLNEASSISQTQRVFVGVGVAKHASGVDLKAVVRHLNKIALPRSYGLSVQHVWSALRFGGLHSLGSDAASNLRLALLRTGFRRVAELHTLGRYEPTVGDVLLAEGVDQRITEAAIFDGKSWLGDSRFSIASSPSIHIMRHGHANV